MELTPIHVRGKRKRPGPAMSTTHAATSLGGNNASGFTLSGVDSSPDSTSALPRKRQQLFSYSSHGSDPLPERTLASAPMTISVPPSTAQQTSHVSFDRRFPLEIVERIFLLSQNLNLPRCSPRLGWMLSNHRTLKDLVLVAFRPTWDLNFDTEKRKSVSAHGSCPGDPELQKAILACPWAKMSILLDAQQLWLVQNREARYSHLLGLLTPRDLRHSAFIFTLNSGKVEKLIAAHPQEESHSFSFNVGQPLIATRHSDGISHAREEQRRVQDEENTGDESSIEGIEEEASHDGKDDNVSMSVERPASIYSCFGLEQLLFLHSVHAPSQADPTPGEDPTILLSISIVSGQHISEQEIRQMQHVLEPHITVYHHACDRRTQKNIHPETQIPEWLLLAGGPFHSTSSSPSPSLSSSGTPGPDGAAERQVVNERLRTVFDTLFWMVLNGIRLQENDSWEVTKQGFDYLLGVDVFDYVDVDNEEDEGDEDTTGARKKGKAVKGVKEEKWGKEVEEENECPDSYLFQYSTDLLVAGILTLFSSLGVFYRQWPKTVLENAMKQATDHADMIGKEYRETCTFLCIQRIARYCTGREIDLRATMSMQDYMLSLMMASGIPNHHIDQAALDAARRPRLAWWYGEPSNTP